MGYGIAIDGLGLGVRRRVGVRMGGLSNAAFIQVGGQRVENGLRMLRCTVLTDRIVLRRAHPHVARRGQTALTSGSC